jgi:HAD superfamily hydrolase (TIGR01509 family)
MIKSILFDLDGVLVNAADWHYKALNLALRDIVRYEISEEEHRTIFNGLPTRTKLSFLVERGVIKIEQVDNIFKLKQHYTLGLISTYCKPDPIKIEMMHKLNAYKKGCVTNSIYKTAYEMLVHSGLNYYMDYVQGNEATRFPKPNPSPYLKAMSVMGIEPKETLIVEDCEKGYTSAIKSGAFVLKVETYQEVNFAAISEALHKYE